MQKTLFFLAVVGRCDGSGGELGVETINEGDGGVKESIAERSGSFGAGSVSSIVCDTGLT